MPKSRLKDMKFDVEEICLHPIKQQGSLLGFVTCVIGKSFYLGGIAVHTDLATRGLRLVYPTKRTLSGQEIPLFHPVNKDAAEAVRTAVASEWERLIK